MKRIGRFWVLCSVVILCAMTFSGCGKDEEDDNTSVDLGELLGTWTEIYSQGWEKQNGIIVESWDKQVTETKLGINSDHTFTEYKLHSGRWIEYFKGTYTVSDNRFHGKNEYDIEEWVIEGLSHNTLILSSYYVEIDDGGNLNEGYEKKTYTRSN